MHGNLKVSFEIELCENKCKCRLCQNLIYPNQVRGKLTGFENRYWEDHYDGKLKKVKTFFVHPNCLIKLLAKRVKKIKAKQLEKELNKMDKIQKIFDE